MDLMLTKEECLEALELIKESYGEGEFQYNYDEVYLLLFFAYLHPSIIC